MHDLVIKGGTVVDGTGAPARRADVAIDGDRITEIGSVADGGRREIDARGAYVTPGFVDVHTHLDAQVAWDPDATSSCWHGVTSVVLGNCGVTFAPVRPGEKEWLAGLMESVEDIPAASILEGLAWDSGRPTANPSVRSTRSPKASTSGACSATARCGTTRWASAVSTRRPPATTTSPSCATSSTKR